MSKMTKTKDCILFSTADWDTPYLTNKQHMAQEFAKLGYRVLYIESLGLRKPKITSGLDFKRIFLRLFKGIKNVKKVDSNINIWVLSPLVLPFNHGNKWIKLFNQAALNLQINFFLKRHKFSNYLIWTYHPYIMDVIKKLDFKKIIYHCVDDLSAIPGINKRSYNFEEKKLLKKTNCVFVTSKPLLKKCLQLNKNTHYFKNVVDFEHFSKTKNIKKIPNDLKKIAEPRILVSGALSEFKMDFKFLNKIICSNEKYNFIFIGKEIEGQKSKILEKIFSYRNVYFLGLKKYKELPNYFSNMQIAFMPIKKNKYTQSMSPMKLNEYIASGLPVISTDLNFLEDYKLTKEIVLIKKNDNFSKICTILLRQGKLTSIRAKKIIGENTWHERTKKMLKIINKNETKF